jgi:hypothetical protein
MIFLSPVVYLFSLLACVLCAWLLARSYFRVRHRLLFWSAACFIMLGASQLIALADFAGRPRPAPSVAANLATLFALSFLLYGFIWEEA